MGKNKKISKLSPEESILDSEKGWVELDSKDSQHQKIMSDVVALSNALKEERATIRFNRQDLDLLKVKAQRKGLGYQTLIGSIVHMYVTGQLIELDEARLALKTLSKKRA